MDNNEVKAINHYGVWVVSDTPTTGVVTNNHVEWLSEEIDKRINLAYEEWLDNQHRLEWGDADEGEEEDIETEFESNPSDTILIGDWIRDDDNLYKPDKTREYAAIVGEICTQVVWSKTTKRCALCSPCYPGQGDLDTPGDWLAYDLPADMYGGSNESNV